MVRFKDLSQIDCHWFLDDPRVKGSPNSPCCGLPVRPESSYCEEHHKRVWRKPMKLEEQQENMRKKWKNQTGRSKQPEPT